MGASLLALAKSIYYYCCIHIHSQNARDFSRAVSGSVKSLSLLLNGRMQEQTPVSREHSQGCCQNRLLYLLERSSEVLVTLSLSFILWGRQYSNRL